MSNQSDPYLTKLVGDEYVDFVRGKIPLLQYFRFEELSEKEQLMVASSLYLLGKDVGQAWLPLLEKEYTSDDVIKVFKDYCPNGDWRFFQSFYLRYPHFSGLSWRGLLVQMNNIVAAIANERAFGNKGYAPHNERAIVYYYAQNSDPERRVIEVAKGTPYYEYLDSRLKYQGVLCVTETVGKEIYSCICSRKNSEEIKISGRVRYDLM